MAASQTSFISGMTNGALSKVTPLDSGNYRQWSYSMKFLLRGEGVWQLVSPDPQYANAAIAGTAGTSAANATTRTQVARTRSTRSPTLQLPPLEVDKRGSSKAAYLIY